jgi:superfamily I DNA/RNA helicase
MLIRGAAGSGKTTTALLRLRALAAFFIARRERLGSREPVKILALTFNRTLRAYIEELASQQIAENPALQLEVATFAKWSKTLLDTHDVLDGTRANRILHGFANHVSLPNDFAVEETEYVLGRFLPENLSEYISCRRDGRGASPRVERRIREELLNGVIEPYCEWKDAEGLMDWNDLAVQLSRGKVGTGYDVIIADEAQDLSANQLRGITEQLATDHSLTIVMDAAQRIYPRAFTWKEAGLEFHDTHRLATNYRNTMEIAKFAFPLIDGLELGDDGTLPDFNSCVKSGDKPIVLRGRFSAQLSFILNRIKKIDLSNETAGFLHPKGGGWFDEIRKGLLANDLPFVELTKEATWPSGDESIALSTLHSAKGLEFDHVVILGLNREITRHGEEENDDRLITLRRLLAMAIGRARTSVTLGYKPGDESSLIEFLDPKTFTMRDV